MPIDYIKSIEGAERRTAINPVECRSEGDNQYFEGYGFLFNTPTQIGSFTEEIKPGAADDVLNDDIRGLFNHKEDYVLGRTKSGTMTIDLDEKGLRYKILFNPNDSDHVRLMEKIKRGDVSQSSFAFRVKHESWEKREGKDHRVITKFSQLIDLSPVTYAAYEDTSVAMRSLNSGAESAKRDLAEMDLDSMRRDFPKK